MFHFFCRTFSVQDAAAYSDARHAGLHYVGDVRLQNAADGYDGQVDAVRFHVADDALVALQTQHRREVFLCRGEAERTTAYVVGTLSVQTLNVFEGVSRAADYSVVAEQPTRLVNRHVVLAEMHAVGSAALHKLRMVVENEHRFVLSAQLANLFGSSHELLLRGVLHAQLNPSASAFKCQASALYISVAFIEMSNKLYHRIICFSGLNKWLTGP